MSNDAITFKSRTQMAGYVFDRATTPRMTQIEKLQAAMIIGLFFRHVDFDRSLTEQLKEFKNGELIE